MFDSIYDWFLTYGTVYALLGLFLILLIDATIFPALPELFAVLAFMLQPTLWWGVAILIIAVSAEVCGNSLLYLLVKRKRLPSKIRKVMKKWVRFLVLRDERILLVNRVAPVLPFTGAFIATCKWNYARSISYIAIGGLAKYSFLLLLVGMLSMSFDRDVAQVVALVAIIIVIALSLLASTVYRKRLRTKKENL